MLKKDLKLRFNQVLLEYTFEDKGILILRKGAIKQGEEPTIVGRKIIAVGPNVDTDSESGNSITIGHNCILGRNAEYSTIPIFFEDNDLDRRKVAKQVETDISVDPANSRFKIYQVKAYVLITDADVVATFEGKLSEEVDSEETKTESKPIIPLK